MPSSLALLMAYEGRGSTSTRQVSPIHSRGGDGAHLFHSLKHWLQPLAVDFTVTVQEGEDVSSGHFSSSHPRANQPYNEERTGEEQEGQEGKQLNLLQKIKYFAWPLQENRWFSNITPPSGAESSFSRASPRGHCQLSPPSRQRMTSPVTCVHATELSPGSCLDDVPLHFQPSPKVPCCCLLSVSPTRASRCLSHHFCGTKLYSLLVVFLTAYLLYSHLSFILPCSQKCQAGPQMSPYFLTDHLTTWDALYELSSDSCLPFQILAPGLLCTDRFRNKPAHVSQAEEQLGKSALPFMHIGDI